MVTGSNPTLSFVWWSTSEEVDAAATPDVFLAHDGRRFTFMVAHADQPSLVGALEPGDWVRLLTTLGAQNHRIFYSWPTSWCTLVPDALWPSFPMDRAVLGAPNNTQVYRSVQQKFHAIYSQVAPDEWFSEPGLSNSGVDAFWPSEALNWELPPVAPERTLVVLAHPDCLHISAFERSGTLVYHNRFDASTTNDALYALGLVYEHLGWSGIEVPLFWHGFRPDWDRIAQGMGSFVLDIKPLSPPKGLPDALGDWRMHPSLQSLFRLWLCAS